MLHRRPASIHPVRLTIAAAARAEAALCLAFSNDPVCRWCWSDPQLYLRWFPRFVQAFGGAAFNSESAYGTSDVRGVALWLPPGTGPDGVALIGIFEDSVPDARRTALFKLLEQMADHHPEAPHWYLPLIGVEPAMQNMGLGWTLMQPILQRCDETGLEAYLESTNPKNIAFYERLGFRTVAHLEVADCPQIVPMVRAPRVKS